MKPPKVRVSATVFGRSLAALLALACNRTPGDLKEWTPSDHDHTQNPTAAQVEVKQDAGSPLAIYGIDEVTVVAWERNCASCHGASGAGDGPQGPLTKAKNLQDAAWQAAATDQSIADVIRNGRGMMPAFPLPQPTIDSLVRLVRLLDPRRRAEIAALASANAKPSAAPSSAAPPASASAAAPAASAPAAAHQGYAPASTPKLVPAHPSAAPAGSAKGR